MSQIEVSHEDVHRAVMGERANHIARNFGVGEDMSAMEVWVTIDGKGQWCSAEVICEDSFGEEAVCLAFQSRPDNERLYFLLYKPELPGESTQWAVCPKTKLVDTGLALEMGLVDAMKLVIELLED